MLPGVCQLKSLLVLLLIVGCSSKKSSREFDDQRILNLIEANWFKKDSEHTLLDLEGSPQPHLFFDVSPAYQEKNQTFNAVVVVPKNSPAGYDIDLSSGQRFYTHMYCSQSDVWKEVKGSFNRPEFTLGYIPRSLDQLGDPQRVLIFSNRDLAIHPDEAFENVRVVGGFIEQICKSGNCLGRGNWASRLVLLAIDANDQSLRDVRTLQELNIRFDWQRLKGSIENLDGRSFMGDALFPLSRVNRQLNGSEAIDYLKNNSVFLESKELKKVRNGCYVLYEKMWSDVGVERPEDLAAKNSKELKEKLRLLDDLKKKKQPAGFAARFAKFTQKYSKEFASCERYVQHGNINLNADKFWFLAYSGLFYRLHKDGYYFDCERGYWKPNIIGKNGKPQYKLNQMIETCDAKDLDQAMSSLPSFLKGEKTSNQYYRFIDYDNLPLGSHRKIYSFVRMPVRKFECGGDPNKQINSSLEVFPRDVKWKARGASDHGDKLKIIY
jgi:hypothetical protein